MRREGVDVTLGILFLAFVALAGFILGALALGLYVVLS